MREASGINGQVEKLIEVIKLIKICILPFAFCIQPFVDCLLPIAHWFSYIRFPVLNKTYYSNKLMIMQAWKDYQEKNKDRFLDELLELLRIPSVSANSAHKEDMRKCAEKVQQRLLEAGADKAQL